eukprot:10591389-Alexandrium_andersonii.AAC.1
MDDLVGCMDSKMLLDVGPKEYPGQVGEMLGMDQQFPQRTCGGPGLQLTKVSEGEKMELDGEQTTLYRQCVESLIPDPEDRMDI